MASFIYNTARKKFMDGDIDLLVDTIKVALVRDTYTPNQDTDEFYTTIQTPEVPNGNGYTTGGATLSNKQTTVDTVNDRAEFDNTVDTEWTSSTITARYGVIWKDTGTPATSPLIALIDFGQNESSDNGSFKLTWDAEGILQL